jgi:RNA polymerase sigma factor FliA
MTSSKIEITNEFIAQWRPMVWKIAKGLRAVAAVYRIDHDDLVQSGMVGLVQAAADFDGRNECSFSSNAWQRIRWSMLDSLREACPQPWNLYQWMLAYNRAADELAGRLGRVPEIEEIAMELGVSVGECRSSLTALATIYADPVHIDNVRGFEDVVPDRKGADALTCAIRAEQDSMINVYLAEQPARVREVILCKYQVGMEEAEIARSLGITRTRVVQILRGMPGRTVGAVQTMRSEINPSKEEIAEKKAREQERLA